MTPPPAEAEAGAGLRDGGWTGGMAPQLDRTRSRRRPPIARGLDFRWGRPTRKAATPWSHGREDVPRVDFWWAGAELLVDDVRGHS